MASIRENHPRTAETTWTVLFRLHKKQTSQTFATLKAAENFRDLVKILGAEKALAHTSASTTTTLSVDQLAAVFFEWKADSVTGRTLADYRRDYANWIRPTLGRRPADSIDETDVQKLVDTMAKRLDPKSVADRHMILHSMYKFGSAKVRRLVDFNPCLETQLPRRTKKPPKGVTLAEWAALYDAALRLDPDAADLLRFIASTGWRWSEAAAVKVRRVEEYADEHGVEHMYVSMVAVQRGGVIVEDAAKSDAGFRRVKLPRSAAAMVRRRLVGKGTEDLVFTNAAGTKWRQQNFLNRTWTRILDESGIAPYPDGKRKTPHAVRHTHAAMLDRAGATLPQMQRRMGHEDIQTTINVYGGMIDDIGDDVLDRLDTMLVVRSGEAAEIVSGDVVVRQIESGSVDV